MSESLDPTASASIPQENFNEILDSIATPPKSRPARQGLPSEYRMRHDAHYVEELATRTSAARVEQQASAVVPTTAALRDLCQEFEGLASCFNLIQQGARPLRERLGVTLAKIGVQRGIRYAQNLRVLLEDQLHASHRDVRIDEVIRQTLGELKDELRLTELTANVDLPDMPLLLKGDAGLLSIALRGCVGSAVALVELSGTPADLHITAFTAGDMLHCEIRQDAYGIDPHQLPRMFDVEANDRAGGRAVAVALGAAKRVAHLHGGQLEVRPAGSGGCVFIFSLPKLGSGSGPVKTN